MTTQNQNKKDDEFLITTILMVFFGSGVLAVDLWYSDWPGMADTWAACALIGAFFLHAVLLVCLFLVYKEFDNPNFNFVRNLFCVCACITILYIGGFRAAKNERQSVIDDSNKAKQEQTK